MAAGAQDGALFLIAVAGVIGLAIVRFAYRIWQHERASTPGSRLPVPGSRS